MGPIIEVLGVIGLLGVIYFIVQSKRRKSGTASDDDRW